MYDLSLLLCYLIGFFVLVGGVWLILSIGARFNNRLKSMGF